MWSQEIPTCFFFRPSRLRIYLGQQARSQGGDHLAGDLLEQIETFVGRPEEDELADADLAEPPHDPLHRVGRRPSVQGTD